MVGGQHFKPYLQFLSSKSFGNHSFVIILFFMVVD